MVDTAKITHFPICSSEQPKQSVQTVRADVADRKSSNSGQNDQTGNPDRSNPDEKKIHFHKKTTPTRNQLAIYHLLKSRQEWCTKHAEIAKITGVPYGTSRRVIEKFKNLGVIKVDSFAGQGLAITFLQEWTGVEGFSQNEHYNQAEMTDRTRTSLSYKDRQTENHSIFSKNEYVQKVPTELKLKQITNQDIQIFWPYLYLLDFRKSEIGKIVKNAKLHEIDMNELEIFESFRRIDFEIEHDVNFDKDGNKYRAGYVVKGLIHGLWRKPEGYLSPEEKRLKELKNIEKNLVEIAHMEKKQGQDEFRKWCDSLSCIEKDEALKNAVSDGVIPHGPKGVRLYLYWQKNILKDINSNLKEVPEELGHDEEEVVNHYVKRNRR